MREDLKPNFRGILPEGRGQHTNPDLVAELESKDARSRDIESELGWYIGPHSGLLHHSTAVSCNGTHWLISVLPDITETMTLEEARIHIAVKEANAKIMVGLYQTQIDINKRNYDLIFIPYSYAIWDTAIPLYNTTGVCKIGLEQPVTLRKGKRYWYAVGTTTGEQGTLKLMGNTWFNSFYGPRKLLREGSLVPPGVIKIKDLTNSTYWPTPPDENFPIFYYLSKTASELF